MIINNEPEEHYRKVSYDDSFVKTQGSVRLNFLLSSMTELISINTKQLPGCPDSYKIRYPCLFVLLSTILPRKKPSTSFSFPLQRISPCDGVGLLSPQ